LFQSSQRCDVLVRIATHRHHQVVTTVFTLRADDAGDPPHCRMVEEEALDYRLQQVHQVVAASDVRQFVQQDRIDLGFAQCRRDAGQHTYGHQDHGPQVADDRRRVGQ